MCGKRLPVEGQRSDMSCDLVRRTVLKLQLWDFLPQPLRIWTLKVKEHLPFGQLGNLCNWFVGHRRKDGGEDRQ